MGKSRDFGDVGAFLQKLDRQMYTWKRRANGHRGAKRHARDLRRRWIRDYKRKTGMTRLPQVARAQSMDDVWLKPDVERALLVLMPTRERTNGPVGRKAAKTLLYESTSKSLSVDLLNAANSGGSAIPAVAEAQFGAFTQMRGIYLSALDAMILPALPDDTIANLRDAGAVVLHNEVVMQIAPTEEESVSGNTDEWHLDAIEISAARKKGLMGRGVTIGFLDTGIDADHPEFAGKQIIFQDFAPDGSKKSRRKPKDYGTHGTHVAALSAGRSKGVAPAAQIAMASVLNTRDAKQRMVGYRNQVAAGLNWLAVEALGSGEGVDIVNASLGQSFDREEYEVARNYVDSGILIVAAIGNDGRRGEGNHSAPAMYECALAVGAVDRNHSIADFSDWGPAMPAAQPQVYKPDLVAPGVQVSSALPRGRYGLMSGTSMACPIVSGAAALVIEQDDSLRGEPKGLIGRIKELTASLPSAPNNLPMRGGRGRLHLASI